MNSKLFQLFIVLIVIISLVVPGGSSLAASTGISSARSLPVGSLDTSFGVGGKVITDVGAVDFGYDLVIQPDSKLIVAGESIVKSLYGSPDNSNFALARYNPDGSLDTSFSGDGKVTTDFGSYEIGTRIALQSDGKIVMVGYGNNCCGIALARYNSNGTLDTSFSGDGKVMQNFGAVHGYGSAVAIQPNGKIIVAGGYDNDFLLERYNSNGSLDTTFGAAGIALTDFGRSTIGGPAIAIQSDGRIVMAGMIDNDFDNDLDDDFALARYNSDGSLDSTFGTDGILTTDLGGDEYVGEVVLQPDGKIVIVGTTDKHLSTTQDIALIRYNIDGSLDETFDTDGIVTTDIGLEDGGTDAVIQPDGKILIAANTAHSVGVGVIAFNPALLRYNSDGSLDTAFGTNGIIALDFGNSTDNGGGALVVQADGKLVLAGSSGWVDYNFAIARYLSEPVPAIFYVKQDALGAEDGSSWTNAFTDLQSALAAAESGDQIWVAAGTYVPTADSDRTISFALKNGVAIYGGFVGTETALDQRNPLTNVTILSGDLNGDDGANFANNSENSYHVVVGSDTNTSAILDGFTITKGFANGTTQYVSNSGGGMYVHNGSPTLRHIVFMNNSAEWGAGMENYQSNPVLTDVVFSDNTAVSETTNPPSGGGIFNTASSPSLTNVTFSGNSAAYGGALFLQSSSNPTLVNVTFSGNDANYGSAIISRDGSPTLTNVTFSNNAASTGTPDGGTFANAGSPIIKNSIFWGNSGGEIVNINLGVPVISYSIIQGGYTGTGNLDVDPLLGTLQDNGGFTQTLALGDGSPAIDAGTDTGCPTTDQRGVSRPQGARCDMGAVEYTDAAPPTVSSSQIADTDPAAAGSLVHFTVTFSEKVTGVDTGDFTLTITGVTGATVTGVSGSDAVYTVAVNTGTVGAVNGTVRLNVVDNDSIQDLYNNPLGGAGAGNGSFTTGAFYTVAARVGTPNLLAPARNYTTNQSPLTFNWSPVTDAARYEIVFAEDSGFTQNPVSHSAPDPTFTGSLPDGKYYWQVRAYNALDEPGNWSVSRSFTVDRTGPAAPTLRSPANDAMVRTVPTFRWNAVSDAVLYQFELDNDSNFSSPLVSVEQRTTTRKPAGGLRGTYSWRVRARDAAGNWGEWSSVFTVTITSWRPSR